MQSHIQKKKIIRICLHQESRGFPRSVELTHLNQYDQHLVGKLPPTMIEVENFYSSFLDTALCDSGVLLRELCIASDLLPYTTICDPSCPCVTCVANYKALLGPLTSGLKKKKNQLRLPTSRN